MGTMTGNDEMIPKQKENTAQNISQNIKWTTGFA
jgi:hypothetical protein